LLNARWFYRRLQQAVNFKDNLRAGAQREMVKSGRMGQGWVVFAIAA
jgi:hypothetical protein